MIYADSMRMIPILCAGLLVQSAAGQPANQTPSSEAESALREGTLAQEHGDLKTAIADFRRALALKPDMVEAHANLGAALAAAGQLSAAIEEDTSALDAAPQNETVRMNLAMAYYRTGDWNQARIEFEKLHAAHPADVNTAILLGYTCNKLGRGADTVLLLAPLEPGHEDDFQIRIHLCLRADRFGKAGRRPAAHGEAGQGKELGRSMACRRFRTLLSRSDGDCSR